jgi:hypothetical protein
MYDEKKVERVNELVKTIKDAEAELVQIFGGESVKRKWTRRPQPESAPQT